MIITHFHYTYMYSTALSIQLTSNILLNLQVTAWLLKVMLVRVIWGIILDELSLLKLPGHLLCWFVEQEAIYRIKVDFNKQFDEVFVKKELELTKISEKNKRIKKILDDLGVQDPVYEPEMCATEKPEMLLTTTDDEVMSLPVQYYYHLIDISFSDNEKLFQHNVIQGSHTAWEVPESPRIFFLKVPGLLRSWNFREKIQDLRSWKVLEKYPSLKVMHFSCGSNWKQAVIV